MSIRDSHSEMSNRRGGCESSLFDLLAVFFERIRAVLIDREKGPVRMPIRNDNARYGVGRSDNRLLGMEMAYAQQIGLERIRRSDKKLFPLFHWEGAPELQVGPAESSFHRYHDFSG